MLALQGRSSIDWAAVNWPDRDVEPHDFFKVMLVFTPDLLVAIEMCTGWPWASSQKPAMMVTGTQYVLTSCDAM